MLPRELHPENFAGYLPQAKDLVLAHLEALRQLPLTFLPGLLREAIEYDFKFPAERGEVEKELAHLSALSPAEQKQWFHAFNELSISPKLEQFDWVNQPAQFVEQLSAYLWTTRQLDSFRDAATEYGNRLRPIVSPAPPALPRLGIAIIGQGVEAYDAPLFRNLRKHGVLFKRVIPDGGTEMLLAAAEARATKHSAAYAHWYVDGGQPLRSQTPLTCISYQLLAPVRAELLNHMHRQISKPGMGPEELRSDLARVTPTDLGMRDKGAPVLDRFQVKLLTEGSGTQIFSTTFAQWAAREILRRAQPLTLLVRFAPRQRQRSMNELLSNSAEKVDLDPVGSLVDADMASYYQWINQQRLAGGERSSFLVWFEGHSQALAISPTLPRGVESNSAVDLVKLLSWTTAT